MAVNPARLIKEVLEGRDLDRVTGTVGIRSPVRECDSEGRTR